MDHPGEHHELTHVPFDEPHAAKAVDRTLEPTALPSFLSTYIPKVRRILQRCNCFTKFTKNMFELLCFLYEESLYTVNPFTPDSDKSKTDKFSKITNWVKFEKQSASQ